MILEKQWVSLPLPTKESIESLQKAINVSESVATLLVQRGIQNFEEAKTFFRPTLDLLHDPFLMTDMKKAVLRLQKAIESNEKILVYGDYDVDGTTSVSLMYSFLKKIQANIEFYIPDRYSEGYGIQQKGVDYIIQNEFSVSIFLDCGIKSNSFIEECQKKGVDCIICDHHRPGEELPPAHAILDPKRSDCEYPYKELTGCGVGFKFLQAFCQYTNREESEIFQYLDWVACSIASDIVPITGENRILTFWGLQKINESPSLGLKALIEVADLPKSKLVLSNLVFGIGPRINAAGRITHAKDSVNLLISNEENEAYTFATQVNELNINRRNLDSSTTKEALEMIQNLYPNTKSTVVYKESWSKGIVGIVASRCIENYHRPTIVLTESNKKVVGSARSVSGFDVYEAIEECSDLLEQFGGHTFAAGLTLKFENLALFREKFEKVVSDRILPEQLTPSIIIDKYIDLENITPKFFAVLEQMSPFGPENMTPTFVSENVILISSRVLKEKHLRLEITQKGGPSFMAIGFDMAHFEPFLSSEKPFSICYQIQENHFNNRTTLQLFLKDIKIK